MQLQKQARDITSLSKSNTAKPDIGDQKGCHDKGLWNVQLTLGVAYSFSSAKQDQQIIPLLQVGCIVMAHLAQYVTQLRL